MYILSVDSFIFFFTTQRFNQRNDLFVTFTILNYIVNILLDKGLFGIIRFMIDRYNTIIFQNINRDDFLSFIEYVNTHRVGIDNQTMLLILASRKRKTILVSEREMSIYNEIKNLLNLNVRIRLYNEVLN